MFFLVTGASGVGKSTVRRLIEPEFAGVLDVVELGMLGGTPKWEIEWRHRMVERAVRRALDAARHGEYFLLCGDPVPPGEVWAAPSAAELDRLEVCLLDAREAAQTARLLRRGDDAKLIGHHVAFADWMRRHVADHRHRPEVITGGAWSEMRWERWVGNAAMKTPWSHSSIDTSDRGPAEVAALVSRWIREKLRDRDRSAMNPANDRQH